MANWIKSLPLRIQNCVIDFNSVVLINFILLTTKFGRTVMPTTGTKTGAKNHQCFGMIALTELRVTVPAAKYY